MSRDALHILQISTYERRGGAEQVARMLFDAYRRLGHHSVLTVGRGAASDPDVIALEGGRRRVAHGLAGAGRLLDRWRGLESYRYPASRDLPALLDRTPDVVHAHNLHGGYFDLRQLTSLSRSHTVVLTLHDAWLLSGHCAHSFDCDRWRTGCGSCPDLTIYPAVRRDATALNWQRKQAIYRDAQLHIATPSAWLMRRVQDSMLAPALRTARVIPNGVDLTLFSPGDAAAARARLGLPADRPVLLTVGTDLRTNPFKDWACAQRAVEVAAGLVEQDVLLVAVGERGDSERAGRAGIRYVPFVDDAATLADYYRAADVYVHPARADTFPGAVVEALACGTPVVGSAVGGIPEQVIVARAAAAEDATGELVPAGDAVAMGRAIANLLAQHDLRQSWSRNARADAERRFDFAAQRDAYLAWYYELCERREEHRALTTTSAARPVSP